MNPKSNWHKRSDHAKKRERYLLSTFRSIGQSLSDSTHSMSNVKHPSKNVTQQFKIQHVGPVQKKRFVCSTWYLGGH